ncbi:YtxC-like family protein [Clostridium tepidiprofundi DSM 19306]|uniref:YtxC-like family protein n=1 Tax=Clostridium tepidiprofundi DSM 19306 TaxID=1121338 RepID=A0A151B6Y1_9CLOT|nr:putative sporulation protein YtxC [Clostridium tepidiprofundi]KYH35502.1 YtxC-like family protein [Clostridium tepidiprofundi DSM 19306]
MLLLTVVYNREIEDVINAAINEIKELFEFKNIKIGFSESISNNMHFIKIYCNELDKSENIKNTFNLYFANYLYRMAIDKFVNFYIDEYIFDNYFFLRVSEVEKIKFMIKRALLCEGEIVDREMIYYINRKNEILSKIIDCIKENEIININGFLTFRIKEFKYEIYSVVDKVIEEYMMKKEYDEFVKLLRYFVDIQESKIDEVNIIINGDGSYDITDKKGDNIFELMTYGLKESNFTGIANIEDVIISGLITNAPKRVIIHGAERCRNKEMIETIKNVFLDRLAFCDGCELCENNFIDSNIKFNIDDEDDEAKFRECSEFENESNIGPKSDIEASLKANNECDVNLNSEHNTKYRLVPRMNSDDKKSKNKLKKNSFSIDNRFD